MRYCKTLTPFRSPLLSTYLKVCLRRCKPWKHHWFRGRNETQTWNSRENTTVSLTPNVVALEVVSCGTLLVVRSPARLGHLESRLKASNLAAKVEILNCKMPTVDIVTSEGWLMPKRQLDETETAGFYVHETCVDYARLMYMT